MRQNRLMFSKFDIAKVVWYTSTRKPKAFKVNQKTSTETTIDFQHEGLTILFHWEMGHSAHSSSILWWVGQTLAQDFPCPHPRIIRILLLHIYIYIFDLVFTYSIYIYIHYIILSIHRRCQCHRGKHPTDGRELRQRGGRLRSDPGEARQGARGIRGPLSNAWWRE